MRTWKRAVLYRSLVASVCLLLIASGEPAASFARESRTSLPPDAGGPSRGTPFCPRSADVVDDLLAPLSHLPRDRREKDFEIEHADFVEHGCAVAWENRWHPFGGPHSSNAPRPQSVIPY